MTLFVSACSSGETSSVTQAPPETPVSVIASTGARATVTSLESLPLQELRASSVEATSELGPQWAAGNVIDGNLDTEWRAHREDGFLSEEPLTLTFRFSEPVSIKEIEIYNAVDNERFSRNHHRIHYLDFAADDLDLVMLTELADDNVVRVLDYFSISTLTLTLEILETYEPTVTGNDGPVDELAVAEIRFFGEPAP